MCINSPRKKSVTHFVQVPKPKSKHEFVWFNVQKCVEDSEGQRCTNKIEVLNVVRGGLKVELQFWLNFKFDGIQQNIIDDCKNRNGNAKMIEDFQSTKSTM